MAQSSIEQLVERVRAALQARDYKAFADCFAERGIYELPYALRGRPHRLEGAAAILRYIETGMQQANNLFEIHKVEARLHPLAEADTAFVEFFLSGQPHGAEAFHIASSAALLTYRDERIVLYRDFPNSLGIAQAAGSLPQLLASLSQSAQP